MWNRRRNTMSMSTMSKSLDELEVKVRPVLKLRGELRKKVVDIARKEKPYPTRGSTGEIAINHGYTFREAEELADANRFLAIIKRDHGADFERIAAIEL